MKSRSHEIGSSNYRIALKFDRHFGSPAAEVPVKFQSNRMILNTNLAALRLWDLTVRRLIGYWNRAQGRPCNSTRPSASFNSLAPVRSECDSKNVTFNPVLLIGIFRSTHDNALRWMPQDLTDDKSALVQVMAWWRQTTSHYLSQWWLNSLSSYGIARSQRVTRPVWWKQGLFKWKYFRSITWLE